MPFQDTKILDTQILLITLFIKLNIDIETTTKNVKLVELHTKYMIVFLNKDDLILKMI